MGAHPCWCLTSYGPRLAAALQELRRRAFDAGGYSSDLRLIDLPIDPAKPSPGVQHVSMEQARQAAGATGTRSIPDIVPVGREADLGAAAPLDDAMLVGLHDRADARDGRSGSGHL
jgi:hypothetical protein